MDIQQYIALDKKLLLNLNGSNSLFWDGFMWVATSTYIWIPTAIILLYIIIKNNKIQETLLTIAMIALVITLKSASNLNGNLNCSKELEHYAS